MGAFSTLSAFLLAAGLLTVTPGLDTVLVLRTGLTAGRAAAMRAALGVGAGCLAWGTAVAVGLGAVLVAAPIVYAALRWCGVLYLVVCGLRMLARPRSQFVVAAAAPERPGAFRRGLLTNLLNPKVGLFYLSFLPQFVPAGWPAAASMIGLTLVHIALGLAWFGILLGGAGAIRQALTTRAGLMRALDRLTGLVFVGFGLRLALDRA
jgi:threonine/homoserine/homoserine lactone efflux protein